LCRPLPETLSNSSSSQGPPGLPFLHGPELTPLSSRGEPCGASLSGHPAKCVRCPGQPGEIGPTLVSWPTLTNITSLTKNLPLNDGPNETDDGKCSSQESVMSVDLSQEINKCSQMSISDDEKVNFMKTPSN